MPGAKRGDQRGVVSDERQRREQGKPVLSVGLVG
jgi:hypothetical protein